MHQSSLVWNLDAKSSTLDDLGDLDPKIGTLACTIQAVNWSRP
jgi:hypothetical protein